MHKSIVVNPTPDQVPDKVTGANTGRAKPVRRHSFTLQPGRGYQTKSMRQPGAGHWQGGHASEADLSVLGEQAMWRAVVTQALMDGACESKKYEAKLEREKARRWLLAAGDDFRTVCHLAGLDPSYVHRRVRRALAGGCQWRLQPDVGGKQTNRR